MESSGWLFKSPIAAGRGHIVAAQLRPHSLFIIIFARYQLPVFDTNDNMMPSSTVTEAPCRLSVYKYKLTGFNCRSTTLRFKSGPVFHRAACCHDAQTIDNSDRIIPTSDLTNCNKTSAERSFQD